ncbi:hypothetical protein IFM89_002381, partial [Coptis chinensis]
MLFYVVLLATIVLGMDVLLATIAIETAQSMLCQNPLSYQSLSASVTRGFVNDFDAETSREQREHVANVSNRLQTNEKEMNTNESNLAKINIVDLSVIDISKLEGHGFSSTNPPLMVPLTLIQGADAKGAGENIETEVIKVMIYATVYELWIERNARSARFGGRIKTHEGEVVVVYNGGNKHKSVLYQEIGAVEASLEACRQPNFVKVEVSSDSMLAVQIINKVVPP